MNILLFFDSTLMLSGTMVGAHGLNVQVCLLPLKQGLHLNYRKQIALLMLALFFLDKVTVILEARNTCLNCNFMLPALMS